MRALPLELRLRIVSAFDDGFTTEEIAERYLVSLSSVKRFLRLRRESGNLEPQKGTGRIPKLDEDGCQLIRDWLREKNDLTLGELQALLKDAGYDLCVSTICRRLKSMALTYKKTMRASEQKRPDVRERREAWHRSLADIPVKNLVFLDESAASTALARLYGRSLMGERLNGSAPVGHWLTITMLSAVRLDGPVAPFLIDGAVDGDVFSAWVEKSLLRELRQGDVVIMDNLSTHRIARVSRLLEDAGHEFFYLPPYSPDFNPIENMWSKIKSVLRRLEARSYDELLEAMKTAILAVSKDDCEGFFKHCGYRVYN